MDMRSYFTQQDLDEYRAANRPAPDALMIYPGHIIQVAVVDARAKSYRYIRVCGEDRPWRSTLEEALSDAFNAIDVQLSLQQLIEANDHHYQTVIKPWFDERDRLLRAALETLGPGHHWQQEDDGTVWELVVPQGEFVHYKPLKWQRTRRGYLGEKKGDLSLKRAADLGYTLGPNQTEYVAPSEEDQ